MKKYFYDPLINLTHIASPPFIYNISLLDLSFMSYHSANLPNTMRSYIYEKVEQNHT